MSSYDVIAKYYDYVVVDPADKAHWLETLIQKYRPGAKSILELACGTASILKSLANDYHLVGLDNSSEMLKIAREKLPDVTFYRADMARFELDESFDAVLCIYDSINHLLEFSEWQSMFKNAAKHLSESGLFIFDMNTIEFLNRLNEGEPSSSGTDGTMMTIAALPSNVAITDLNVTVTETHPDGRQVRHATIISESSFEIARVQSALEEYFEVITILGEQQDTEWTDNDNKVVFVCRRK